MDISKISVGFNPPYDVNAIIEIPQGGEPVKYELDKESGAIYVDRFLHTAMFYPGNYGFVPHTLSGDGDPMDILVVGPTPVVPGAISRAEASAPITRDCSATLAMRELVNLRSPVLLARHSCVGGRS